MLKTVNGRAIVPSAAERRAVLRVSRTCSSPRGAGSSPSAAAGCARFSAPRSNSWLPTTAASTPIALSARISGSPAKKLKIGAPWKQSPESRWSTRADARPLAAEDVGHARGAADVGDGVELAEAERRRRPA